MKFAEREQDLMEQSILFQAYLRMNTGSVLLI